MNPKFQIAGYTVLGALFGALAGYSIGEALAYKMWEKGIRKQLEELEGRAAAEEVFPKKMSEVSEKVNTTSELGRKAIEDYILPEERAYELAEEMGLEDDVDEGDGRVNYSKIAMNSDQFKKPPISSLTKKYTSSLTMSSEVVDDDEDILNEDDRRLVIEKVMYLEDDGVYIYSDGDEVPESVVEEIFAGLDQFWATPSNWPEGYANIRNRKMGKEFQMVYIPSEDDRAVPSSEEELYSDDEEYPTDEELEEEEIEAKFIQRLVEEAAEDDEEEDIPHTIPQAVVKKPARLRRTTDTKKNTTNPIQEKKKELAERAKLAEQDDETGEE